MKLLFVIVILGVTCQIACGQELVQKAHIVYNTTIKDSQGREHKGYIATMNDSTIFMSAQKFSMTFEKLDLTNFEKFGYSNIEKVSLQERKFRKSILIGAISGFIIGGIVTYYSTSDPAPKTLSNFQIISFTRTQSALAGAVFGAGVGCLLGAAVKGLTHKVFKIHGKRENLFEMKDKMISELY